MELRDCSHGAHPAHLSDLTGRHSLAVTPARRARKIAENTAARSGQRSRPLDPVGSDRCGAAGAIVGYRCLRTSVGRLSDLGPGSRLGLPGPPVQEQPMFQIEKLDQDPLSQTRWDEIALGTVALMMVIMLIIAG